MKSITIYPQAGLANRLRVLLAFRTVTDKRLRVYWPIDISCNGHFLDVFEPLPNTIFVSKLLSFPRHYKGFDTFDEILKQYGIQPNTAIKHAAYAKLQLKPEIGKIVDRFLEQSGLREGIALHIRRTDHVNLASQNSQYTTDEDFHAFIASLPANLPIFLATDNQQTQADFQQAYPGRLHVYSPIQNSAQLRHTSLEHAVIDMFIAARTRHFKGSGYSSYSTAIMALRND